MSLHYYSGKSKGSIVELFSLNTECETHGNAKKKFESFLLAKEHLECDAM